MRRYTINVGKLNKGKNESMNAYVFDKINVYNLYIETCKKKQIHFTYTSIPLHSNMSSIINIHMKERLDQIHLVFRQISNFRIPKGKGIKYLTEVTSRNNLLHCMPGFRKPESRQNLNLFKVATMPKCLHLS